MTMTAGKFEQLVALATYANVSIQSEKIQFDLGPAITEYCGRLEFIDRPQESVASSPVFIAPNAEKWFVYLKEQNANRVKLHFIHSDKSNLPDHISTAFIGGGSRWIIEVQYEGKSDIYESGWNPSKGRSPRPWKVQHVLLERNHDPLEDSSPSVGVAREHLDEILKKISSFAEGFDHSQHWAKTFNNARWTLVEFESQQSDVFIPFGIYSTQARQLIEASFLSSSVFGGMGSWNDLAFSGEDNKQYSTYSKDLYEAIRHGIVAGVNSYP